MALSVSQMRTAALNTIRDLVLEEETLCIRRGGQTEVLEDALFGGKGNLSAITGSQPWMDCLVRCLEMDVVEDNHKATKKPRALFLLFTTIWEYCYNTIQLPVTSTLFAISWALDGVSFHGLFYGVAQGTF